MNTKEKIINKIGNYLLFGILTASLIAGFKWVYYEYMPLSYFVDYKSFDLQVYHKGEEPQVIYVYRNSKISTTADFYLKPICNGITNKDWDLYIENVILQKTKGFKTVTINLDIDKGLPVGECDLYIFMKYNIRGHYKYQDLIDKFIILPPKTGRLINVTN